MQRDFRTAALTPADRALLEFAERLTLQPASMGRADVEALRRHGFDDDAVADAVNVTALFALYNRLADGLGVEPEPDHAPEPCRDDER